MLIPMAPNMAPSAYEVYYCPLYCDKHKIEHFKVCLSQKEISGSKLEVA
jgi:hypothetical protein